MSEQREHIQQLEKIVARCGLSERSEIIQQHPIKEGDVE